jgi:ferredoxin--NADP+ reductase
LVVDNKATVTYVQLLKEDLVIIRLVPKDGPVPDYKAGQFITLGLPNPEEGGKIVRRAYSIASNPENREYIELVIRWVRKPLPGRLTTQIFNLKEGDEILWLKPTGLALLISEKFPNGEKDNRRIVCIGGGTGLAPFVSYAQHLHETQDKREIKL